MAANHVPSPRSDYSTHTLPRAPQEDCAPAEPHTLYLDSLARSFGVVSGLQTHATCAADDYQRRCIEHLSGPDLPWERQLFSSWLGMIGILVPPMYIERHFAREFFRGYTQICSAEGCPDEY